MCGSIVDIQCATDENNPGKKKKKELQCEPMPNVRPAEYRWRPLFNEAKFG